MNYRREHRALDLILSALLVLPSGLVFAVTSQAEEDSPKKSESQPSTEPTPTAQDLLKKAAEMEQLSREIEAQLDLVSPHPKRRYITTSTQVPEYREYMRKLVDKIEQTSREHYPVEARDFSGSAIVTISIGADGALLGTIVNQSSGHKQLDDAAVKLVQLAAPFDPLPAVDGVEIVDITRTFQFSAASTPRAPVPRAPQLDR